MGDLRRHSRVVPLGFAAIQVFRREGLGLEDLVIKRQHQMHMTARWAAISAQHGFPLLAHEYLALFRRPEDRPTTAAPDRQPADEAHEAPSAPPFDRTVTPGTTVWSLPHAQLEAALPALARRVFGQRESVNDLLFLRAPQLLTHAGVDPSATLDRWLHRATRKLTPGGILAIEARDVRLAGVLQPLGLEVCRALRRQRGLRLREIIAAVPQEATTRRTPPTEPLTITHRYLLIASCDPAALTL